jgi:hypothetical protein
MKSHIIKAAGMALLLAGMTGLLLASENNFGNYCAPEIDASTAGTALTLLSGAVLLIRSRKK